MPLFRRRKRPEPTESDADDVVEPVASPVEPRRLILRRPALPFLVNWPTMLLIVGLIVVAVFSLLLNQGALPVEIVTWWPLSVAVLAVIWFLAALIRRDARSLLGSTALFGLSISMLLAAQHVASLASTWVGVTFIAVGTGIVLRGLLLRHQPIG
jgi:hypothetical protein